MLQAITTVLKHFKHKNEATTSRLRVEEYQRQHEDLRWENEVSRHLLEEFVRTFQQNRSMRGCHSEPNQGTNFQPFLENILLEPIPLHCVFLKAKMFTRHQDPLAHVKMFRAQMLICGGIDDIKCKMFVVT